MNEEEFARRNTGRGGLSRRSLIWGAGAIAGAGLFRPRPTFADDNEHEHTACALTNPIPGGVTPFKPFGVVVHHNPLLPAKRLAVAGISDPSQITDFDGFVGLTHIRGSGTGTDTLTGETQTLAYQADMGFSQGRFVGVDGRKHEGTFAFVWLDLYAGPVGSVAAQIHDYNVHIDSNDVFWMIPVEHDAVRVDFDEARARLRVNNLQVFDDHDLANSLTLGMGLPGDLGFPYPKIDPVAPVRASVSFDVEWSGILDMDQINNSAQTFKGLFFSTNATIKWSAEQPGFRFESETPDPARNLISVLGREQNGVFFAQT